MTDEVQVRVDLGAGPLAVRTARREVRAVLADAVDPDTVDTAVLLVSELVTNATLHVGGQVALVVRTRPGVVRLEVRDSGSRPPLPRRALDRERTSGRGLHLLDRLAADWGTQVEPKGKVVWCEVAEPDGG